MNVKKYVVNADYVVIGINPTVSKHGRVSYDAPAEAGLRLARYVRAENGDRAYQCMSIRPYENAAKRLLLKIASVIDGSGKRPAYAKCSQWVPADGSNRTRKTREVDLRISREIAIGGGALVSIEFVQ